MVKEIDTIIEGIETQLQNIDKTRDLVLPLIREGIKLSGRAIEAMHLKNFSSATDQLLKCKKVLEQVQNELKAHPKLQHSNLILNFEQEFCEAQLLHAILTEQVLPDPKTLCISPYSYLLGLADVIGELRRFSLEELRLGREEEAAKHLEHMQSIFSALTTPMFPKNIVHGLRHKVDVGRSILERTRADVTIAIHRERLRQAILKINL